MKAIIPLFSALGIALIKEAVTVTATPDQGSDVTNQARVQVFYPPFQFLAI